MLTIFVLGSFLPTRIYTNNDIDESLDFLLKDNVCLAIDQDQQVNCGFGGMTMTSNQCKQKGCCYQDNVPSGVPQCFLSKTQLGKIHWLTISSLTRCVYNRGQMSYPGHYSENKILRLVFSTRKPDPTVSILCSETQIRETLLTALGFGICSFLSDWLKISACFTLHAWKMDEKKPFFVKVRIEHETNTA